MSNAPLLELQNLNVKRDNTVVCRDVNLAVAGASVTYLSGSNGAGKSTLLDAIAGIIPAAGGRILYGGEDVTKKPAHVRARKGIAYVPQGRAVFPSLTVVQNIFVQDKSRKVVDAIFETFPSLAERKDVRAELLSGGEQQMLKIGMALIGEPQLLIVDELSLGLAPHITDMLADVLKNLSQEGLGVLLVEQFPSVAERISDRGYAMTQGQVKLI